MKARTITENIQKKHKSKIGRILVLTGARQTGKRHFASIIYIKY